MPCVDDLIEGVDYHVVNWDFAASAPATTASAPVAQPAPGQPCPPGTKMVFGLCRRTDGTDTDEERNIKDKAKKEGSEFKNNKQITAGGKKFGWAMKGGKPILVEWGSVAGVKKVGGKAQPAASQPARPAAASTPAAAPASSAAPARPPGRTPVIPPASSAPLSGAANRSAYIAGGGNAAAQRGTGSTVEQVSEQGRRNLNRLG